MVNQPKKFQRTVEDFICEKCGTKNVGDGFTNHCFNCLTSKHVDINPGDRAEKCCGVMNAVAVDYEKGEYHINHKCVKCGVVKRKRLEPQDNFDAVLEITKKNAK